MSYYGREVIEDLISKVNIVDVIGRYVPLKLKGNSYFGLCPFHNEKTPSFSVSEEKQMYYCFGCHSGGNVVSFIMNYENVDFIEAVKILAEIAGVTLPEGSYNSDSDTYNERNLFYEINKEAANFYYKNLLADDKSGLKYFEKRGLLHDTIKSFGLGYATKGSNQLYSYLKDKGYKDENLLDCGLFTFDETKGVRDRFWNRVMFPIVNVSGKVVGFGGRVLGEGLPKYANSPETKFYNKREHLYGYYQARKSRDKRFILCEGYMDVISLHKNGFTGAFASLGTALTVEQVKLIKNLYRGYTGTHDVYLVYDSDEAGINAKIRAIPMLREQALVPKVVELTPCKDPDEFCKKFGPEKFLEKLNEAKDGLEYILDIKSKSYDMDTPSGKNSFIYNELVTLLNTITEPIEYKLYTKSFSKKYDIDINDLQALLRKSRTIVNYNTKNHATKNEEKKEKETVFDIAEKQIITWMVENEKYLEVIKKYLTEDDFKNDITRKIFIELANMDKIPKNIPSKLILKYQEEYEDIGSLFETSLVKNNSNVNDVEKSLKQVIIKVKENTINYLNKINNDDFEITMKTMKLQKALQDFKNLSIDI